MLPFKADEEVTATGFSTTPGTVRWVCSGNRSAGGAVLQFVTIDPLDHDERPADPLGVDCASDQPRVRRSAGVAAMIAR